MIKSIVRRLGDVPAGGWFYLRGNASHKYIRSAWEFKGDPEKLDTVLVVDLDTGEAKRLAFTHEVIETAKASY